ncbi:hypothetical protein FALBO_15042 [Fusarium albosuccineum]|uniref:Zn(2)-C6 fungal-type domain-containing protein n=1 Tax=Fusarium albosuccineum TaxID=1237068 RepID=A0A8H4KY62_9HYPO|nr:hypothetical protein FALBO_15042 [Fusarium albosuccineum]
MAPQDQAEQVHDEAITGKGNERVPGKRPAARGTAFYPRKRANTACQVCRARKTKCDNRKPTCSYCLSVGATCIQSPVDLSAFDPASLKILERLDELEKLIKEPPATQAVEATPRSRRVEHCQNGDTSPVSVTGPRSTPRSIDSLLPAAGDINDIPLRSILPEKMESLFLWSVLTQQSTHSVQCEPLQPSQSYSPGCSPLSGLVDMDTQGVKQLLDNFFIHVHCKNPILEECGTRQLVTNTILEGIDWSANSCLSLIICALGKIATPLGPSLGSKPDTTPYVEAQALFQAAQKRIGTLLTRSDIIGAQCFFLSGVFMMCTFQPFAAWRFFSQALAACQALPFLQRAHRLVMSGTGSQDQDKPGVDETQQEAVYWSAWKSERELRSELVLPDFNMPHSTSVLYPPFFPTPPHPLDSAKTTDSNRQQTSWLFYLAEISLRRLSSRVCNEILELHRVSASNLEFLEKLAVLVPDYEAQAHQWADSLPPELSLAGPPMDDNVCIFVLRGHLVNFFETIYWPFVMAHVANLERGALAALPGGVYVDKALEYHVLRVQVNEAGFLHRHHGTWLMIRGCIRSAILLLGARLLGSGMPAGWQDAVQTIIQLLRSWEDEMPELPAQRAFLQGIMLGLDS